ncbi:hypothetical protein R3P38DRAFT_3265211 [Favolaschia claudopus]|uniref:Uncharacterized protein n=1 Tax=Favolaschia claudopus TaxID=2862362 RepID=A0AAW0C2E2_9AGAR
MSSASMSTAARAAATNVPTPIRAITTPLRTTAAPPIPPASQLYEPLAKSVLRRRLTTRIFPYSLLVSLLSTALSLLWFGRFSLLRLAGASVALWLGGLLPVVFLRKSYLTVTHTSAPSPLSLLNKSFTPPLSKRTTHAIQTHLLSALLTFATHVALDSRVPVFIKSRKHPYTPHPVLVLLALTQCILASLYVLRAILRDVWVFPFRRPTLSPSPSGVVAPLFLALFAPFAALLVLFVVVPILRYLPIVSILLRPIVHPRLSVLRVVPRAWAVAAQTAWGWEATGGVWSWAVGEPLYTTPAVRALVSGISVAQTPAPVPSASAASSAFSTPSSLTRASSFLNPSSSSSAFSSSSTAPTTPPSPPSIYTHLAYTELLALASSTDPAAAKTRGAEVFDVDGAVWGRLVREALVLLGREYQVLLARGGEVPTSSAPPPAAPSSSSSASGGMLTPRINLITPVKDKNIFAPKAASSPGARVSAALASGGALESVVVPLVPAVPAVPLNMNNIGLNNLGITLSIPEVKWQWAPLVKAVAPLMPGWVRRVLEGVGRVGMGGVPRAWREVRKGREAAGWVPRREVCVGVVEGEFLVLAFVILSSLLMLTFPPLPAVLTHLTCASLTEDRFGVVQRDIPRILEALISFLGAVEQAQASLRPAKSEGEMPEEEKVLIGVLGVVGEVVGVSGGEGGVSAGVEGEAGNKDKDGSENENEKEGKKEGKKAEREERERRRRAEMVHLEEARTVLGEVGDALKDGIARITRTFGDKLRAFRFPPRTAARLQEFVEFHVAQ